MTELKLDGNRKLKKLYCEYSSLPSLEAADSPDLKIINCQGNGLTSLNVLNNINLEELNCWDNNLTGLDISNNHKLTYLDCSYNFINSEAEVEGLRDDMTFIFNPQKSID